MSWESANMAAWSELNLARMVMLADLTFTGTVMNKLHLGIIDWMRVCASTPGSTQEHTVHELGGKRNTLLMNNVEDILIWKLWLGGDVKNWHGQWWPTDGLQV